MSISPTIFKNESRSSERRSGSRESFKWVVLVYFGQDNWGKLVDLSESGMCFEFAQLPSDRERINFTLEAMGRLPAWFGGEVISDSFQVAGDVRWTRDFERTAGVQFVSLAEESREQIRKWLSFEAFTAPTSNKTEKEAQVPLPEPLEPVPAPPETPPAIYEEELQLDAEDTDSAAEPPADPTSPLVQKILEAPTFQAYSEIMAEEEMRRARTSESNQRVSRTQVIGVTVGLAAVVVIGGVRGILPRLAHGAPAVESVPSSTVGDAKPVSAESSGATGSPRPFLVEVLDTYNRRWLLWFDDNNSKNAPTQAAYRSAVPSSHASLKTAGSPKQPVVSAEPAAPHKFTLIAPKVDRSEANNSAANSSSLAAPVVRDELHAPLEAPLAGTLTSPAMPNPVATSVPVGGDVQLARLIQSVSPVYPALAKTSHVKGDVTVDALIDSTGKVTNVKLVSGPALLQKAAMDAVRVWKYEPARLDGHPVPIHLSVTVKFQFE